MTYVFFLKNIVGTSPWKITLSAWLAYYLLQNFFHLIGLNGKIKNFNFISPLFFFAYDFNEYILYFLFIAPEPLARLVNLYMIINKKKKKMMIKINIYIYNKIKKIALI